jgi:hypothetical protein
MQKDGGLHRVTLTAHSLVKAISYTKSRYTSIAPERGNLTDLLSAEETLKLQIGRSSRME